MLQLDPLALTLSTSARAASAAVVDEAESEPEPVADSEPDSDAELAFVLSLLAASVDAAPDEFEAPLGELSLLGVVVTGSFREQPESPAKVTNEIGSGTNSASARPAAEIRDVEANTRIPKQESPRRSSGDSRLGSKLS